MNESIVGIDAKNLNPVRDAGSQVFVQVFERTDSDGDERQGLGEFEEADED